MEQERRRSPRFPFISSAEVHEEDEGTRLSARISDISPRGCYVDTINPLPGGTLVRVRIFSETQSFEVRATVVYSHANLGMGVSFQELSSNALSLLSEWIPGAA